jgi:hypothetical protein
MENLVPASKPLESIFEEWSVGRTPDSITFFDVEKAVRITVSGNQLEAVVEGVDNKDEIVELMAQLFSLYFEGSGIDKFAYVGSQHRTVYNTDAKYKEYAQAFYDKYYGDAERIKSIFADEVMDVIFSAEGIKDGLSTRLQFGPVKQEQVSKLYPKELFNKDGGVKLAGETGIYTRAEAFTAIDTLASDVLDKIEETIDASLLMHKQAVTLLKEMQ